MPNSQALSGVEAKVIIWGLKKCFSAIFIPKGKIKCKTLNSEFSILSQLAAHYVVTKTEAQRQRQIWRYLSAELLLMHMFADTRILQPQVDWDRVCGQKNKGGGAYNENCFFIKWSLPVHYCRILEQPKLFCLPRTSQNYFSEHVSLHFVTLQFCNATVLKKKSSSSSTSTTKTIFWRKKKRLIDLETRGQCWNLNL